MKPVNAILLFIIVLITSFNAIAQKADTSFFDKVWQPTTRANALYYRIITKEDGLYKMTDYYINGTKQMEGYSTSPKEEIKTGKYIYYSDKGIKTEEGVYSNNQRAGMWTHYYENIDKEIVWFKENYVNGDRSGDFTSYYQTGELKSKEEFKPGKSVTGKRYDVNGQEIAFIPFYVLPEFSEDVHSFLAHNLVYPRACVNNNIEGVVYIELSITKEGKLSDLNIRKGADSRLNTEAVRVALLMKNWKPGMIDGKPEDMTLMQPITFKLED